MKIIKRAVARLMRSQGYELVKKTGSYNGVAVELNEDELALLKFVTRNRFTMVGMPRLVATLKACKYVVENNIPGDFVECGVWRGGNGIIAKKIFEKMGSNKQVYMFDTFAGMTEPTQFDVVARSKKHARAKYEKTLKHTHSDWCYASINDVKNNLQMADIDVSSVKFVQGDVCKTLDVAENLPKQISILRLDTDWYESTKKELEVLYPRLEPRGVLIIDDYGHWEGARKAVDEFFGERTYKPLFNVTDHTGRVAIKM